MVATGKPLAVILDELSRLVDTRCDKSLASILLIDPNSRCLRRGAGPSLSEAFMAAVDGVEIGPCVGSCGTATYRKVQVIVSDIATDPLWANYRELALANGLRSGWSTPILSSGGSDAILSSVSGSSTPPTKNGLLVTKIEEGQVHAALGENVNG
jgi:GAF domain-containing protein